MSDQRHRLHIKGAQGLRDLIELFGWAKSMLATGHALVVEVRKATRTLAQNALMWSCLNDLSRQVKWDGTRRPTAEGWKDYLTAHLNGQDLVPNMDGTGFIAIGKGKSTSDMTIAEMTAVIDLAHAFGAGRGVKWSRTSLGRDVPDEVFDTEAREVAEPLHLETTA